MAREAGFENSNMITLFKQAATKLALDRVPSMAKALEVDTAKVFTAMANGIRQADVKCLWGNDRQGAGALLRRSCLGYENPFPRQNQATRTILVAPRALKRFMRAMRMWIPAV